MKIVYITAQTPWGKGETFILEEMLEIKRQGIDLLIIPRNPPKGVFHKEANELLKNAVWFPLINFKMAISFLKALLTKIFLWKILGVLVKYSRNPWILIKNLAVLPKGIFIAEMIRKKNIEHIHAHWGSTTATMAYITSRITGIPWSFTLHRWDIAENNMLKEKMKPSKFVRIISEHGRNELLEIIGTEYYKEKIHVIHMGVKVPESVELKEKNEPENFVIVTPANLVEKKGHKYLIEACFLLIKQGIKNFRCFFYGEGPLKNQLKNLINEKRLKDYIKMPGIFSHEELIKMYENKDIDLVVLPSIITKEGELEGIPVALMEAMTYKIPVISTNTGGIPELLYDRAGIIVEEKNAEKLAESIKNLMEDNNLYRKLVNAGYKRVQDEFNIQKNTQRLLNEIE